MSIATKTGDNGSTGLLFGTRVSKTDSRIVAVGDVDELSAAIGLARCLINKQSEDRTYADTLKKIQKTLTLFMGEVVTEPKNRDSYVKKYEAVSQEDLTSIDSDINSLEKNPCTKQTDWIMYGDTEIGAALDFSSKVCRRAERSYTLVKETEEQSLRPLLSQYINRLSDFLHLLARYYDNTSVVNKIN
jgi:cob(I)alamin adenosyltransferase